VARVASVRPTNFTLEWIRELTLRYTTPDIHCRHRRHECDGGISYSNTGWPTLIPQMDMGRVNPWVVRVGSSM